MGTGNPMRWPSSWKEASALDLLKGCPVDTLLVEDAGSSPVAAAARRRGLRVVDAAAPPDGVTVVKNAWPGIREMRRAVGGPTGLPWIESSGFLIRLERLRAPGRAVWVSADPPPEMSGRDGELKAWVDAAMHGGRWIVSLSQPFASGLAANDAAAQARWQRLAQAMKFFGAHPDWDLMEAQAVLGILGDFFGSSAFFAREVLKLTARQHQAYRILEHTRLSEDGLRGLKAVFHADNAAPAGETRRILTRFAEGGGLVLTGPKWGAPAGSGDSGTNPRFTICPEGRGRIAISRAPMADPYLAAQDATLILSHRHDIVRFWNATTMGSYFTQSKSGGLVQVLEYASHPGRFNVSLRVAGPWRSARLWTLETASSQPLTSELQDGGIEVHLPPVPVYAAIELA